MNSRFIVFIAFLLLLISAGLFQNKERINALATSAFAEDAAIEGKAAKVNEACDDKSRLGG